MKKTLYLLVCLLSFISYSQNRILKLRKINSNKVKEIKEFKRIIVKTIDGEKYYGRFSIINDSTILVKHKPIFLDSIVKVRQKSLLNTITKPLLITVGSIAFGGGIALAYSHSFAGVFAFVFVPLGTYLLLVPAIVNNHSAKRWEYFIETK